jgi:hypothetical protein
MAYTADDPRVQWLAAKVCHSLGCHVDSFNKLLTTTPTTYEHRTAIISFLEGERCLSPLHHPRPPAPGARADFWSLYRPAIRGIRRCTSMYGDVR